MSTRLEGLRGLVQMALLKRERLETQMAALLQNLARLEGELAVLRQRRFQALEGEDPRLLALSEQHWVLWQAEKERLLLSALAKVMAQREDLLPNLRRAVGQHEAILELHEDEVKARQAQLNKKLALNGS